MKKLGLATVRMMRQQVMARALHGGAKVAVAPGCTVGWDTSIGPSVMIRNETQETWLLEGTEPGEPEYGAPVTVVRLRSLRGTARVERTVTGTVVLR